MRQFLRSVLCFVALSMKDDAQPQRQMYHELLDCKMMLLYISFASCISCPSLAHTTHGEMCVHWMIQDNKGVAQLFISMHYGAMIDAFLKHDQLTGVHL